MSMTKGLLATLAALALCIGAAAQAATVKVATYKGVLASGYDMTGLFGTPGANLAGLKYTSVFVYQLGTSDRVTIPPNFDQVSAWYSCNPLRDASITINGISQHITRNTLSDATDFGCDSSFDGAYHFESSGTAETDADYGVAHDRRISFDLIANPLHFEIFDSGSFAGMPGSLDTNVVPVALTSHIGGFDFIVYDFAAGHDSLHTSGRSAGAAIYSVHDAVPEPASWALMVGGFGLVGAAVRRRRAVGA